MSTIQTAQDAQSTIPLNANETHNNASNLVERKEIPGTPFTHIRQGENWFIVMGDYRLTEPVNSEANSLSKLHKEFWMIAVTVCSIISEKLREREKLTERQQEQNYETESL